MVRGSTGKKRTALEIQTFKDLFDEHTPSSDEEWKVFTAIYNAAFPENPRTIASLRSYHSRTNSKSAAAAASDSDTAATTSDANTSAPRTIKITTKGDLSDAIKQESARRAKVYKKLARMRRSRILLREKMTEVDRQIDGMQLKDAIAAANHQHDLSTFWGREFKLANKPKKGRKKRA